MGRLSRFLKKMLTAIILNWKWFIVYLVLGALAAWFMGVNPAFVVGFVAFCVILVNILAWMVVGRSFLEADDCGKKKDD